MVQEQGARARIRVSLHPVNDRGSALLQRRYCAIHGATKRKAGQARLSKGFTTLLLV
jgi:hypothetical protein